MKSWRWSSRLPDNGISSAREGSLPRQPIQLCFPFREDSLHSPSTAVLAQLVPHQNQLKNVGICLASSSFNTIEYFWEPGISAFIAPEKHRETCISASLSILESLNVCVTQEWKADCVCANIINIDLVKCIHTVMGGALLLRRVASGAGKGFISTLLHSSRPPPIPETKKTTNMVLLHNEGPPAHTSLNSIAIDP